MLQSLNTAATHPQDDPVAVGIAGLSKRFGHVVAVQNVSIDIERGSFVSLLGPSGCGKTTVLRAIAGLERPDEGSIRIGDEVVNDLPVWQRNIGMVFQNYALFPHMSVADNVGFGLRVRGAPASERRMAVAEALEMVRLGAVAERLPKQLSGGQRQRVAIARALVTRPRLLLLDEPLGALDRKLREQMQLELKLLQRRVGITTVMVTHDQEEALTLSDRIIVMNAGKVVQAGPPDEVYRDPRNAFIADFIGTSNFFSGEVVDRTAETASVRLVNGAMIAVPIVAGQAEVDTSLSFFIRPENVFLSSGKASSDEGSLRGCVLHVAYSGAVSHCYVDIGLPQPVDVLLTNANRSTPVQAPEAGDEVVLSWTRSSVTALTP
ncbi:ABC transporter ATP-binding protein [Methylobacterium aquaticum]|uniref:Spermidine/putrescine import ATP-binding protein PotA n=1 Tax=Methylobacterium aquaticum TaxID=270351 RepID=A0A0J6SNS6_9HYPH|nr:ABC transporter ATP-binding protein [Methylobacterium aquaticum]KMO36875.1 hypothetical protein VP06_08970 [Methylobacterium aquaticum]